MNPFKNRPLLFISLIIYTFLLTAILLYFRFPAEDIKLFCQTRLTQLLPGSQCTISALRYKFPLGVKVETIHFTEKEDKGKTLFIIDQAFIRPKLTAPLSEFHITCTAYKGEHDFSILINRSEQKYSLANIHLLHLDIGKIPILRKTFNRDITGLLSGNGNFHSTWNNKKLLHNGQGNLTIDKGSFSLLFPILSLSKIDLKELQTHFTLQKDRIQFNKGHFQGKELKGEFSGNLTLATPFKLSAFTINGALEPLAPLLKTSKYTQNMVIQLKRQHNRSTLPFLLEGSVQRPRFKFDI